MSFLVLLLLWPVITYAIEARSLRDYTHTAWTQKDGAPTGIWAMAQSADGWLWLGSSRGLTRFDGATFEAVDVFGKASSEPRAVSSLYADRGGDLWVFFSSGKIMVLPGSDPERAYEVPPVPGGQTKLGFVVDGDGRPWASNSTGLYLFSHGKWNTPSPAWSAPTGRPDDMLIDGKGSLWLLRATGDSRLAQGASHFELTPTDLEHGNNVQYGVTPDGRLWSAGDQPLRLRSPGRTQALPFSPSSSASQIILIDEDSSAWTVTCRVVCRIPDASDRTPSQIDAPRRENQFTVADGLSNETPMTLLEDRTGSVWAGSFQGLDRFRKNDFRTSGLPRSLRYFALAPAPNGEMLVATASGEDPQEGLWRIRDTARRLPGYSEETTALMRSSSGDVLLGGPTGLWDFRQGKFARRPDLPDTPKTKLTAMVKDADGALWAAYKSGPVLKLEGDHWIPKGGLQPLPDAPTTSMLVDTSGALWQGYYSNLLTITTKGQVRTFTGADGIHTVTVTAILAGEVPLIGGEMGTAWFDASAFHMLKSDVPDALKGVTGIVETADGTIWLNGYEGAVRLRKADLRRAMTDPGYSLPLRIFGSDEGMPGGAQQVRPLPTVVEGTDGRLWFATSGGVVWLNPKDVSADVPAPRVIIRSLKVGNVLEPLKNAPRLPAGTRSLSVTYTAIELARPDSLRFRYRLDGVDIGWQQVGPRREAIYTNLAPGRYLFHVSASLSGGEWARADTTLQFTIAPAFYQTGWFLALCLATGLLALWLWYMLRVRQITRRLRARLLDRHTERERIARELHDTLLQGVSALLLDFRVLTRQLGDGAAKTSLTRALERGEATINEGRERVGELRAESVEILSLDAAFMALAAEFDGGDAPALQIDITGRVRRLHPIVLDELHRIGREVLFNAYAHAHASRIDILLVYRSDGVQVRLKDDGIGIDPEILSQGGRPGHWGLRGMHERAASIGADLRISSSESSGTEILVSVPAARAYPARRKTVLGMRVAR